MRQPVVLYLVGGAVMVHLGLRETTRDVDYAIRTRDPTGEEEFERAVRALKEEIAINLEPADPSQFLPVPASLWDDARFVGRYGEVDVYYFNLASQVIAKAARGYEQDQLDVMALLRSGQVTWDQVEAAWVQIRGRLAGWLRYEPDVIETRLTEFRSRIEADGAA